MPAKRLPWLKLWPEAVEHEKVAELDDGEFRSWVTVLAKAANQPERWHFNSVKHAAVASGRPTEHIESLVRARLLDECPDGLWIHDWRQWQERYPSEVEDSANAPTTLREDSDEGSSNGSESLPATLPRASAKMGEGRRKNVDERVETGDLPPSGGRGNQPSTAEPVPKPASRPNQVKTLIDKIRTLDVAIEPYGDQGFTGAKLKANPDADLDLIAEAYVSFRHGEWPGSKMLRESGALAWVIGDLGGYIAWRQQRSGHPNGSPRKAIDAPPEVPADSPFLKYRGVTG